MALATCTDVAIEIARSRSEFSRKTKRDGFARSEGRCEAILPDGTRCNAKLHVGKFRYDHRVPDRLGGEPTLANLQVICDPCDKFKYPNDRKDIDHNRRMSDRHIGATGPRQKIPARVQPKAAPQRKATTPLIKTLPQRRSLYRPGA